MNVITEVGLTARRELRKNLRGIKGVILLLLSLIGGTATALLVVRWVQRQLEGLSTAEVHTGQELFFSRFYRDPAMGKFLADAPLGLVALLWISVWIAPALIWLAGFDGIAADVQYRSVRYFIVRTRKTSFYIGKAAGLFATVATMTFLTHLLMWVVSIAQGASSVSVTLSWGFRLWLVTLPISAAWCGIAVFVASLFRTPGAALLVTGFSFFLIFIVGAVVPFVLHGIATGPGDHETSLKVAEYLAVIYPNSYDEWILSPHVERMAGGLAICLAFAVVPVAIGARLFSRSDA